MAFTYSIQQDRSGASYCEITGYDGASADPVIPETIEGLPVRSIASHAFAGKTSIRSLQLPANLQTIRSFAFYGCLSLRKISLHNQTQDLYDGVIRGCSALELVEVFCDIPDNYVTIRELLRDEDVGLRFRLHTDQGELRLTFPEYVREALEDTMARAIHFSIEGAGMAYRECVGKYRIDYDGYDRLLGRLTDYDFRAALHIALDRLMYPVSLRENARLNYCDFITAHSEEALHQLMEEGGAEEIRFLTSKGLLTAEAIRKGAVNAARKGLPEISAILLDAASSMDGILTLEDW